MHFLRRNELNMKSKAAAVFYAFSVFCLMLIMIMLTACGSTAKVKKTSEIDLSKTGTRDNKPVVCVPEASGTATLKSDAATVDISHTDDGYFMVEYTGSSEKVKLQLVTPDGLTYTYTLHSGYETFALTGGDGTYKVMVFEHAHDDQYTTAMSESFDVKLKNEFTPYLYPNQYVNFNADCKTVAMGEKLAKPCSSDLEVVTNVYDYCLENITYDVDKAKTVESGYLPKVDEILDSGKGICFDYAAVMATMLRTQRIPTRLEVGYVDSAYHAWVSVYLKEIGWVNGIIEFDGKDWELMDPTLAASKSEKQLKNFIGDGSVYNTKFVY